MKPPAQWGLGLALVFLLAARAGADLAGDIRAALGDRILARAQAGIEVVELGESPNQARVLFSQNAAVPLIPASNMKLVTTTAAYDRLGLDFRFRTALVKRGEDLIIVGDGDPSFGDAELLKKAGWDVTTVFQHWAAVLKKQGITAVRNVLVDDSVFDEQMVHPNWDGRHLLRKYGCQVAGFNLNVNSVDFYLRATRAGQPVSVLAAPASNYYTLVNRCVTGRESLVGLTRADGRNEITLSGSSPGSGETSFSISIHDPSLFSATVFAETIAGAGIKVSGVGRDRTVRSQVLAGNAKEKGLVVLAVHETPLTAVVHRANKDSINLYAEALCKRVGSAETGQSGSWAYGTAATGALLKRVGVEEKEYRLDDGCGLSERNAISANAICRLLIHNFHAKHAQAFMESLSVAGQDGTLEKRFEGSDLRGRVIAKTGYIKGVNALSGYLKTRDNRWYVFSILFNDLPDGTYERMKGVHEAIVKAIDRHHESRSAARAGR